MTWRRILLLWLLLALSVQLMIGEILLVQAAVSRLPDEKIMLAALGVMFWLEVLIERPWSCYCQPARRAGQGRTSTDRYGCDENQRVYWTGP